MQPVAVIAVLGAPCAGKSTIGEALARHGIRFSVRSHFEPKRQAGLPLPSVGNLLPDEVVWNATLAYLAHDCPVLDGFPGTVAQANLLRAWCHQNGRTLLPVWVLAPRRIALNRARLRRVCLPCDGGVDEADARPTGRCSRCNGELTTRPDDVEERFPERWLSWRSRSSVLHQALAPSVIVDGRTSRNSANAIAKLAGRTPLELLTAWLAAQRPDSRSVRVVGPLRAPSK